MPGPGSTTSPRRPRPPASSATSTGPPGPCRTAFVTSSVMIISARQQSSGLTLVDSAASRTAFRARAGAYGVAGKASEIDDTFWAYPIRTGLCADSLADDPLDFAAVGTALRGLHHRADDRADRLVVSGLDLLDGV